MKNIFLAGSLLICSAALAQENDLFDIQSHLQKKTGKKNIVIPVIPQQNKILSIPMTGTATRLSHVLPNGDRVMILPGDNMPCVQPDMRQFTIMPAAQPNMRNFHTMPNLSTDAGFLYHPGIINAEEIRKLFQTYKQR